MTIVRQLIRIFLIALIYIISNVQTNGVAESSDPTNQELALLDWSSGIQIFYCTDAPFEILVEPFKQALIQALNKFCRNATACRLVKSISFKPDYVVLLDGYPKLSYGTVQFRFVIVLPPNAVPMDNLKKPFLTKEILSNFLNASIEEFEWKFGWKVSSYERFPKFDSVTEFMNIALIPIGFILLILMLLLAYWSSTISRSTGGSEEWFVTGTSGGKSTAMKRTLEIIEEQKILFAEKNGQKESCTAKLSKRSIQAVPETTKMEKHESNKDTDASKKEIMKERNSRLSVELVPIHLSVIQSESTSTLGSTAAFKNVGGRRVSHRRLSSIDNGNFNVKRHRKKRFASRTKRLTQRQWKLTSMALSGFGKSRRY
ncbi:putative integral membrane protein [Brugia pahangi]